MSYAYGNNLSLTIDGGSHDPSITMRLSGFPKGMPVDMPALLAFLARRAPGNDPTATKRKESDIPYFLSGLDENRVTSGDALFVEIKNENAHSEDYKNIFDVPRPSHADFAAYMKYGKDVDLRGGGHFSGRLTSLLCVAGGLAMQYLKEKGISVFAHASEIAGVKDTPFDLLSVGKAEEDTLRARRFPTLSEAAEAEMRERIEEARIAGDSVGGTVTCAVLGLPVGLGEHMFASAEARIAAAAFSVPGVKGIEFGAGFASARKKGSENNDPFITDGHKITTLKNDAGGILGGMTSGMPLVFTVAVKPTPSIAKEQKSVSLSRMENTTLAIRGRHDPCIVPRAVPVIEAVASIAILDMMLDHAN